MVSRHAGLVMVFGARRAANRAGYAWRRKQRGMSSAVELSRAAGRFPRLESGRTTAELLASLVAWSFERSDSTQQSRCTAGIEEAIIELERVQAFMECRVGSMEGWVTKLWNLGHKVPGPFDDQCANRTVSELNACMAVFGGSLDDACPPPKKE